MKTLNYALRFLLRTKSYTIINLLGLAISLACSIILLRYIHRELTVDIHCIDRGQVYGVQTMHEGNRELGSTEMAQRDSVCLNNSTIITRSCIDFLDNDYVNYQSNRFFARTLLADSAYFKLFPYRILQGTISLEAPESVLLMENYAKKLFGKENPIGKVLCCSNGKEVRVSGVLKEPVNKRMLNFDMIVSPDLFSRFRGIEFIRFTSEAEVIKANEIGKHLHSVKMGDGFFEYTFSLIPVSKLYWESSLLHQSGTGMWIFGSRSHLFILGGICLLILLSGVINFVNLYLVLMVKRGRVYILRKVFGADAKTLFIQIFTENFLLIAASMILAWGIIEVTNIPISHMFNSDLVYTVFDWVLSISILLLLPLLVSVYAFLQCQRSLLAVSIRVTGTDNHSVRSRMILLFTQYIITFLLVVLSLYFSKQLDMMLHTDPGFRTEDIIQANMVYESNDYSIYTSETMGQRLDRISEIDQLMSDCPDIQYWTVGYWSILNYSTLSTFQNTDGKIVTLYQTYVTPDFFKVFDINFVEGDLPKGLDDNARDIALVANRSALKALGYTSCEGATTISKLRGNIDSGLQVQPIVAVIENYYDGHISEGIRPTVFVVTNSIGSSFYQISCNPGRTKAVIDYLKGIQKKVYGTEDFRYSLLKDEIDELYKNDRQVASVYTIFACVAIVIVCLGLFGISLYDIQQRYREIAIRKINGASLKDLYLLLARKYLIVLGAAFAIAIPLAWYLINEYTKEFVVKAPIGLGIFLIALLIVSVISLGTLFWQINKASHIDPAKIMKIE